MKKVKLINSHIIGLDELNNVFELDGFGVWQQITVSDLFKINL